MFRLLVCSMLAGSWTRSAAADDLIDDWRSEFDVAAIIARVQLVSRTPVSTQPYNVVSPYPIIGEIKDEPNCGYLYHAKVVESIKGDQKEFDFFSSEDADFSGFDHDYLVVVYKRWDGEKLLDAGDLRLTIPKNEVRRINCLIAEKYYVGTLRQTMFSFDNAATAQFGGDWLAPANRLGYPCCDFAGPSTRLIKSNPDSYGMKSWISFRPHARPSKWPPEGSYPVASWPELRDTLLKMKREQEKMLPVPAKKSIHD